MRLLLSVSFFFALATAQAQFVSFGVKGGIPATPALPGRYPGNPYLDTGRWTVGPTIEFHLISGLSLEADALFRGYTTTFVSLYPNAPNSTLIDNSKTSVKAWDFPLLLKYRFPVRAIHPFVTAGAQLTHRNSDFYNSTAYLPGGASPAPVPLIDFGAPFVTRSNTGGPTGGFGVEFRYRRIKFDPEVRYAHLASNINSATILLGVTF